MEWSTLEVASLQRHLAGDSRAPVLILLVAVGFVLLISCANITNLQLVRAAARHHEIAVRGALGAARARLARQFLTESMVVGALAACTGLLIGAAIVGAIRAWQSPKLPWLSSISLDPYMFAFTLVVSVLAAISFGAAPAISGSRANLLDALKATSLRMSRGREHRSLRNAFVVGEVALALVLLIAAGLLLRSFSNLMRLDPGYDPRNVLTAKMRYVFPESATYPRMVAFFSDVLSKAQAIPSVRYAAVSQVLPLEDYRVATTVWFGTTGPPPTGSLKLPVPLISVSPDFFRAMGTTMVAGRAFTADDNESAPGVAIVNQAFVRKFIGTDALGRRFHSMHEEHCANCAGNEPPELQIVGIVEDVRQHGLEQPVEPEVYLPFAQAAKVDVSIVIATTGNPAGLAATLRAMIRSVNREVPVFEVSTLEQRLSESIAQRRLTMFLLSAFAALALLLAAVGVYGVISYSVVRRTQEIGIRIAMGATRASVLRLILGQHARMILLGSAIGLALAVALSGAMTSLLYGVRPRDIATFALSCVVLTAVAFLASAAPAMRAARTDPSVAIRYE
jgi:predicted permease